MNTNRTLRFLLASLFLCVASSRADEEQDLIAVLKSNAGIPQKCAACQRLRFVGTVQSVPALSALLTEERTGHAARYALEGMPYPEAGAAIREALEKTSGLTKAGLVDSVGWRRDTAALPLIKPLLTGADATLAAAAASALGRIGNEDASAALTAARDSAPAAVQVTILDSLLQCAERRLTGGDASGAAALFRGLNTPKSPASVRLAAWRGLVLSDASARAGLVTQAIVDPDQAVRAVALKVIREVNDAQVFKACLSQWASLPAESQLAVLDASLKLGKEGIPTVRSATASQHAAVRVAGWQALGDLGDASSVAALVKAAASGESAERNAAREALARLRGEDVRVALLAGIDTYAAPEKAELLRVLGARGDREAVNVLVANAGSDAAAVRLASLESLRKLAVPDTIPTLLELAAKSKSEDDREPVLKALYAACQASRNKEETSRAVVAALNRFPTAERRQVLPLLAELATSGALEAAQAATRDPDSELAKEAVRTLAQWPNSAPTPSLLDLALTSDDSALRILALRASIEVAAQEPDFAKRLALLQQAAAAAKSPAEKMQAIGQIGQVPTPEALQVVLTDMANPALANEAALAAVNIAEKLAAANPKLASEVAAKVLAQTKSQDIVKRALALRGKIKTSVPFIRDWLVSGPYSQAGAGDALAVFDIAFAPEKADAKAQWKPVPRGDMVDLMGLFPNKTACAAYLKTQVIVPNACEGVLLLGSDDGVKAWLNGAVVHANNIDRGAIPDQDMAPIKLKQGANELLLKITQGGGGWNACARIVSAEGLLIQGLRIQAVP